MNDHIDKEDLKKFYEIFDTLYPLILKAQKASAASKHPKAEDYFATASEQMDEAYLKLQNAGWYLLSGRNFQDVELETF